MKLNSLILLGFVFAVAACADKEQPESEEMNEPQTAVADETEESMVDADKATDSPDQTMAKIEDWRDVELLDHMHAHAEHLDDLNIALDDGNLEAAATPAYWLSSHMEISGLPEELKPIVANMRDAANAVEQAEDLETARAAADRIVSECQGCHVATGYIDEIS